MLHSALQGAWSLFLKAAQARIQFTLQTTRVLGQPMIMLHSALQGAWSLFLKAAQARIQFTLQTTRVLGQPMIMLHSALQGAWSLFLKAAQARIQFTLQTTRVLGQPMGVSVRRRWLAKARLVSQTGVGGQFHSSLRNNMLVSNLVFLRPVNPYGYSRVI